MFISHSICAWSISLNLPSRATPALLMTMLSPGCAAIAPLRERRDLAGLADIEAMYRHLSRLALGDLGGDRLQSRLVAIGQRQVAAARRQLERQRAADAAGRAGYGSGGSMDRSHVWSAPSRRMFARASYTANALWQSFAGASPGQAGRPRAEAGILELNSMKPKARADRKAHRAKMKRRAQARHFQKSFYSKPGARAELMLHPGLQVTSCPSSPSLPFSLSSPSSLS